MKIVQINSVCGTGSTGRICQGISECLCENNIENYILYGLGNSKYPLAIKCAEKFPKFQSFLSRIKGNFGFNSEKTTKRLIDELNEIQPDIVHLHNLHSHNCNVEKLMSYFETNNINIIWTFHDCWAFTGYCPYYVMEKCYKWKNECNNCPLFRKFSWFTDNSKLNFNKKKDMAKNLSLTIVAPSKWLANETRNSFYNKYPIKVIYNGINLSIFKPRESKLREKYNIKNDKFIILGVAYQWEKRKGADVFVELNQRLDASRFQIVLVGTNEKYEQSLPNNVICIRRTENPEQLAEIYSGADLFVNPTREEVFGLVNVEANACGLPVLTFNTGGSPECINYLSGSVVPCDDIDALELEILRIEKTRPYNKEDCITRAKDFNEKEKYKEYIDLYTNVFLAKTSNNIKSKH